MQRELITFLSEGSTRLLNEYCTEGTPVSGLRSVGHFNLKFSSRPFNTLIVRSSSLIRLSLCILGQTKLLKTRSMS